MKITTPLPVPEACPPLSSRDAKSPPREDGVLTVRDGLPCIDVRGLEPPRPLMKIVALLENPETGDGLIVLHDRDPLLLYPELEERGWDWTRLDAPEGELHLRLTRRDAEGA